MLGIGTRAGTLGKHHAFALEGRGIWHAASASFAQQVLGPLRVRADYRVALDMPSMVQVRGQQARGPYACSRERHVFVQKHLGAKVGKFDRWGDWLWWTIQPGCGAVDMRE